MNPYNQYSLPLVLYIDIISDKFQVKGVLYVPSPSFAFTSTV